MEEEYLFVYGTLKYFETQEEVIGRAIRGNKDRLEGYIESEIEIEGEKYPIIIPHQTSSIEGFVLPVSPEDLGKIDEYETSVYRRTMVTLRSGLKAWVYVKAEDGSR